MSSVITTENAVILQSGLSKIEVWPSCGAILNSWQVQLHDKPWQLIEGYLSVPDFAKNCEAKGFRSCKLSPFVCRLKNGQYEFEGEDYEINKFILGEHAIHGLLYDLPFEVINSHSDETSATLVLAHHYKGDQQGYPFAYAIQVAYTLYANNQLGISTTVTNKHDAAIPITDGWHPYFLLGRPVDELEFMMQTSHMVEFDEGLVPTGELIPYTKFNQAASLNQMEFDHCFLLRQSLTDAACRIINRRDNIQLSIQPDISYPYLQVYIPPHRESIAIENLSAAPDAFNNHIGLIILDPGETISFSTSYMVSAIV